MAEKLTTTILVVDDQAEVRKLVSAMLSRQGYHVLTANSGESALIFYKQRKAPIDLLLTDVVTPGISGPMLAEKLAELQPGLKVLFMSGYDDTQVVRRYVIEKGFALIPKPFTIEGLAEKVREVLEAPKWVQEPTTAPA
ncbi:MAG: response regulator [Bryobacteraceae bacterium]